jgi:triosephosphate isomerase (TIM)
MSKLIIGNWKANKTRREAEAWFKTYRDGMRGENSKHELVIAPPFPLLELVSQSELTVAVQDLSPFPPGSYTGAVPAYTLLDYQVRYAIVGHSERRQYFHETHQDVAKKVEQALENGITPVVCIDREYLREQASALASEHLLRCIVAYEPLAAIGTGNNVDVGTVKEVIAETREVFGDIKVIYGGSVDEFNIGEYLLVSDGVLVGGASLNASQFIKLIK